MALTFDYKGWGDSEGARSRLAPWVADVQAALTFLGTRPEVDPDRLGIYGTSYGGATVVWVGAIDPRVKCVVRDEAGRRRAQRGAAAPAEAHDAHDGAFLGFSPARERGGRSPVGALGHPVARGRVVLVVPAPRALQHGVPGRSRAGGLRVLHQHINKTML